MAPTCVFLASKVEVIKDKKITFLSLPVKPDMLKLLYQLEEFYVLRKSCAYGKYHILVKNCCLKTQSAQQ